MYYTYNVNAQCHCRYSSSEVDALDSWVDAYPGHSEIIIIVGSRRQTTELLRDVRHNNELVTVSRPAQVQCC